MKNCAVFVFILTFLSCTNNVHSPDINAVNVSAFSFFQVASATSIPLSATEGNILLSFGNPLLKRAADSETNQLHYAQWKYPGAIIYLQAGRMVKMELQSSAFAFVFNGSVIKVGEDVAKLKAIFPKSFTARSPDQLMVALQYNGEPIDSRILFHFNSGNQITSISLVDGL
jgi:hypothetical protein